MNESHQNHNTAVAASNDDPFAGFAQEAGPGISSAHLKFTKGEWLVGQHSRRSRGTQFVANMGELLRGWVRWQDNKPTDQSWAKS